MMNERQISTGGLSDRSVSAHRHVSRKYPQTVCAGSGTPRRSAYAQGHDGGTAGGCIRQRARPDRQKNFYDSPGNHGYLCIRKRDHLSVRRTAECQIRYRSFASFFSLEKSAAR